MDTIYEEIDYIEKFLNQQMGIGEKEFFIYKIKQDKGFEKLYLWMKTTLDAIKISAAKSTIEEKINAVEKTNFFD